MKILIVDDDKNQREALKRILRNRGFEIIEAEDPYEALKILAITTDTISAILSDLYFSKVETTALTSSTNKNIKQKDGLDFLHDIRYREGFEKYRSTDFFIRTGSLEITEEEVLAAGGTGLIIKTDSIDAQIKKIKK